MLKKINWDDVPTEEVTPQMHRKIVSGEKLMIAKMKFKDGFHVPLHSHENEQITEVYYNTDMALEAIAESQIYQGVAYQKYVLTLCLILN